MSLIHKGESFVLVDDPLLNGCRSLGILREDGLFEFGDGDLYTPANVEFSFDGVRYLSWMELEKALKAWEGME